REHVVYALDDLLELLLDRRALPAMLPAEDGKLPRFMALLTCPDPDIVPDPLGRQLDADERQPSGVVLAGRPGEMEVAFDDRCEDCSAPVHCVLEVGDLGDELPGVPVGAEVTAEPDHLIHGVLVLRLTSVAQRGLPLLAHWRGEPLERLVVLVVQER